MRKFKNIHYLLMMILISHPTLTFAQKLPKIQTSSLQAPQGLKIDGKTTEWNDKFQAYNWGNHIYYTLSNDENNLYLTARMDDDILGSRKIFKGGITFTIIPSSKKTDKISITFPVISPKRTGELEQEDSGKQFYYKSLSKDTISNKAKIESLVSSSNNSISNTYKQLHITGIPEITDTLISIYNTQNIMAAASFDKMMRYTYELAIPLKYLEGGINKLKSVRYNIKLRTRPIIEVITSVRRLDAPVVLGKYLGPGSLNDQFLYNDTDFSGEYNLAL